MLEPLLLEEPILEYLNFKDINALEITVDNRCFVKANEDKWILPFMTRVIEPGVSIYIPDGCIGILRNVHNNNKIHFEPKIYEDTDFTKNVCISVKNRSIFPVKINAEDILAKLIIIKKVECHIISR